jgi:hypothetical protein
MLIEALRDPNRAIPNQPIYPKRKTNRKPNNSPKRPNPNPPQIPHSILPTVHFGRLLNFAIVKFELKASID